MDLQELKFWVGTWAERKGWGFTKRDIPEKLMLVTTELAEAMEDYRDDNHGMALNEYRLDDKGKPIGFGIELADSFIRILHICHRFDIDLEAMTEAKMKYNERREFRHGGKIA